MVLLAVLKMRVLAILALVQIARILADPDNSKSDTNDDSYESNETQDYSESDETENYSEENIPKDKECVKIQKMRVVLGNLHRLVISKIEYPEMISLGRTKCRTKGGPDAEDAVVKSMKIYVDDLTALENETQLQLEAASLEVPVRFDSAVGTACHWFTISNSLTRNLSDSLKRCWSPEEYTSFDIMDKTWREVLQFICQNEGSRILEFLHAQGAECLSLLNFGVRCVWEISYGHGIIANRIRLDAIKEMRLDIPWGIPIIRLDSQACSALQPILQCLVGMLKTCQHSTASYDAYSLFDIIMKSTGCRDIIEVSTSLALDGHEQFLHYFGFNRTR